MKIKTSNLSCRNKISSVRFFSTKSSLGLPVSEWRTDTTDLVWTYSVFQYTKTVFLHNNQYTYSKIDNCTQKRFGFHKGFNVMA